MRQLACWTVLGMVFALGGLSGTAHAQFKGTSRPFESYARKPAVSPYMNLINNNNGVATNYQSLVRPQLDQNNFNNQSSAAIKSLQRQAGASQNSKSSSEGNLKLRATGHAAVRGNYSHYYPALNR